MNELREVKRLAPEEAYEELKTLLQRFLDLPRTNLVSLIRELSRAYGPKRYTSERKNAALALIVVCRERNLLDQLSLCWALGAERRLKRGHWFALAQLEGCVTLFSGTLHPEPWFFSLARLADQLGTYAQHGYVSDPGASLSVRQNTLFASTLLRHLRVLRENLEAHQEQSPALGALTRTVTSLRHLSHIVREQGELFSERLHRIQRANVTNVTKRLAGQHGGVMVMTPLMRDPHTPHAPSRPS